MPSSHATVRTEKAQRYLAQLCKHFAHKVPVDGDQSSAHVRFDPGDCRMEADATSLRIHCEADQEQKLQIVQYIVEDHVVRFGWREKLAVEWISGDA